MRFTDLRIWPDHLESLRFENVGATVAVLADDRDVATLIPTPPAEHGTQQLWSLHIHGPDGDLWHPASIAQLHACTARDGVVAVTPEVAFWAGLMVLQTYAVIGWPRVDLPLVADDSDNPTP